MKTGLALMMVLGVCGMLQAEPVDVTLEIRLVQDGKVLAAPKVGLTCESDGRMTNGQTSVINEYMSPVQRELPVGMILDYSVGAKEDKLEYSCQLTIREHRKSVGSYRPNGVMAFSTREFILWGLAESGKEVAVDLGDKMTMDIVLTRVPHHTAQEEAGPAARR